MNFADTLSMLLRRWYITLPAILLTLVLAFFAFMWVKPTFERSASLVLLPDNSSIPEGGNPYLYLSGLNNVADVLTRAAASESFLESVTSADDGNEVTIARDPATAGPVILVKAESSSRADAGEMVDVTVDHITDTLDQMQADEGLAPDRRITIVPLAVDDEGLVVQRTRLAAAGAIAVVGLLLSIIVPAMVEGLSRRRRRRPENAQDYLAMDDEDDDRAGPDTPDPDEVVDVVDAEGDRSPSGEEGQRPPRQESSRHGEEITGIPGTMPPAGRGRAKSVRSVDRPVHRTPATEASPRQGAE